MWLLKIKPAVVPSNNATEVMNKLCNAKIAWISCGLSPRVIKIAICFLRSNTMITRPVSKLNPPISVTSDKTINIRRFCSAKDSNSVCIP